MSQRRLRTLRLSTSQSFFLNPHLWFPLLRPPLLLPQSPNQSRLPQSPNQSRLPQSPNQSRLPQKSGSLDSFYSMETTAMGRATI